MKLSRWFLLLAGIASVVGLHGCGAGAPASRTGKAMFTVIWPPPSRLIPAASNSIKVDIKDAGQVVASQTLARPSGRGPATLTFNPNANGTGVAQAAAGVPLQISSGQASSFSITMDSTIDHVDLAPLLPTVVPGGAVQFILTAKDSAGNIVLTSPNKIAWVSNNTAAAIVNTNGLLTAVGPGATLITATDTESGKSVSTTVGVPVSWWKAENNTVDSADGNNGAIYGNVSYAPGVSGMAFNFDGVTGRVHIPDAPNLKITGSLTIDARINLTAIQPPGQFFSMILMRADDRSGLDPYFLGVTEAGRIHFDTTTTLRPLRDLDPNSNPGLGIGNSNGVPPTYDYPFKGLIDEVKLFNAVVPPGP